MPNPGEPRWLDAGAAAERVPRELLAKLHATALAAWHLGYAHGTQDAVAAANAGEREYASWFDA